MVIRGSRFTKIHSRFYLFIYAKSEQRNPYTLPLKNSRDYKSIDYVQTLHLLGHHHLYELFIVDLAITINISLTNHFINLLVSELFTEVGHDVTQFSGRDETISVLVEDLEGLKDFFLAVCVLHLAGHHCQEFREVNGTASIGINLTEKKME